MLSVAALSTTAIATPMRSVFSPSQHPFMKRAVAAPAHFSFDPYKMARAKIMNTTAASVRVAAAAAVIAAATPLKSPIAAPKMVTSNPPVMTIRVGAAAVEALAAPVVAAPKVAVAPKANAPSSLSFRVVAIAFKQGICNYRANFRVVEGDVVIVEGDRGEHIGTIKSVYPAAETEAMAATVTSKIVRRATAADLEVLATKTKKEAAVLEEVTKIAKELRLNASIADVEFQLDNNKLTIFVERATSSTFVDFRKVQRTLFKMFHCRIWFVYMDELSN